MPIRTEELVTTTLADVDVTDDYRVVLTTPTGSITLTPTDAEHLADHLTDTAARALTALAEDYPIVAEHDGLRDAEGTAA